MCLVFQYNIITFSLRELNVCQGLAVVYIYARPTVRDEYFLLRTSEKSVFELLSCPTGRVQIKLGEVATLTFSFIS